MSENFAGWHPDPLGRHEHRYYDGEKWTEHVADKGELSTDPLEPAREDVVAAPSQPSMINLPAISPAALQRQPAEPEPEREPEPAPAAEPEPEAVQPEPAPAQPEPAAYEPPPATTAAQPAVAAAARPAALAALLSVIAPGTGHLFLGIRRERGMPLLVATAAAIVLSWLLWPIGLIVWALAAASALFDLRSELAPSQRAAAGQGPLAAVADVDPGLAWRLVAAAGVALPIALILPWYRAKVEVEAAGISLSESTHASGFEALELIDLILLAIGVVALVVAGLRLAGQVLPSALAGVLAAAGAVATVLVLYRLLFSGAGDFDDVAGVSADISIGRAIGILLAFAASLTLLVGGAAAMAEARRPR